MKLSGNLSDLTVDDGNNKRKQLPPEPPKAVTQNSTGWRELLKNPAIRYVNTKLDLPEDTKKRMDILFASDRELRKKGKNNFMVKAIEAALKKIDPS